MEGRYVDGQYASANPGWHADDAAAKVKALAPLAGRLQPGHVVDVGAGTGDVLAGLRSACWPGARCEAWDLGPFPKTPDGVARHVGDWLGEGGSCDVVLFIDVLEHLDDPDGALAVARARAPVALIRVPLEVSARDALRPHHVSLAREQWGHRVHLTARGWRSMFGAAGWRIRAETYDRPWRSPTNHWESVTEAARRAAGVWPAAGALVLGGWSWCALLER